MSKSSVAIEVDVREGEIFIKSLGAGARDFFCGAPWPVVDSTLLRDLIHVHDWPALEDLTKKLPKTLTAATAANIGKLQLNLRLGHFQTSTYLPEQSSPQPCSVERVEYINAKLQVSCYPEAKSWSKRSPVNVP